MSDSTSESTEEHAASTTDQAAPAGSVETAELKELGPSDDNSLVEATWAVAVVPGDGVSIHFSVAPRHPKTDAILSVNASFVRSQHGVVCGSYGGATFSLGIDPKPGQRFSGDSGVDLRAFPAHVEGQLEAVLAGVVKTEAGSQNFFFTKPFDVPGVEEEE